MQCENCGHPLLPTVDDQMGCQECGNVYDLPEADDKQAEADFDLSNVVALDADQPPKASAPITAMDSNDLRQGLAMLRRQAEKANKGKGSQARHA